MIPAITLIGKYCIQAQEKHLSLMLATWMEAHGGDVDVLTNWPGMQQRIVDKRIKSSVKSSDLILDARYTVRHYFAGIQAGETNISDVITFNSSYL